MAKPIKSKNGLSVTETLVHAFAILCTGGFWYPVYRMRKHQAERTTKTYI
jgi:hypothetical protein